MISARLAHDLLNRLQSILSAIEMGDPEKARAGIRSMTALLSAEANLTSAKKKGKG